MIQTGIFNLLSNASAIASLVGTRVYPITLPTDPTLPALTYHVIGGDSQSTFETSGLQKLRMQFDVWGGDPDSAMNLRETLREFLNGYQGLLSDGTYLQNAELIQSVDFFENDARQYRCMVEFYFYFDFPD